MTLLQQDNIVAIQKGMLFFLLIISGNFIGELLSCRIRKLFLKSMLIKHIIALISLYFFVIISDSRLSKFNPLKTLLSTIFVYFSFIVLVKSEAKFFFLVVIILGVIAFLQIYTDYLKNKENLELNKYEIYIKNNIHTIQLFFIVSTILITLFGMLIYMGMKKLEYGNTFRYISFFLGKVKCSNNEFGNINIPISKVDIKNRNFNWDNIEYFIKKAFS